MSIDISSSRILRSVGNVQFRICSDLQGSTIPLLKDEISSLAGVCSRQMAGIERLCDSIKELGHPAVKLSATVYTGFDICEIWLTISLKGKKPEIITLLLCLEIQVLCTCPNTCSVTE